MKYMMLRLLVKYSYHHLHKNYHSKYTLNNLQNILLWHYMYSHLRYI